jgi:glycosyltransferase involved in cell wall biosynthesis
MSPRLAGLSIFLPAHNEEGNIERVVEGFKALLPRLTDDYEVIVVDDGSSDHTGQIADRMASADRRVRVVHHPFNQGYGAAVASGIAAASKPYVLLCDGDGQFDPADLALLTARIKDFDVVVGNRVHRADNFMRRLNGKACQRQSVVDTDTGAVWTSAVGRGLRPQVIPPRVA